MASENPHEADVMAARSAFAVRPSQPETPKQYLAPAYTLLLPILSKAARKCGYALGLHGSMARDLDLIAVPWVEDATDAETLIDCLTKACGGFLREERAQRDPAMKPHGRLAWSIHLGGGPFLDVSVMPLATRARPDAERKAKVEALLEEAQSVRIDAQPMQATYVLISRLAAALREEVSR